MYRLDFVGLMNNGIVAGTAKLRMRFTEDAICPTCGTNIPNVVELDVPLSYNATMDEVIAAINSAQSSLTEKQNEIAATIVITQPV
jgi:hypothetical protein